MTTEYQQIVNTLPNFFQGSRLGFDFYEIRKDLKAFLQNQDQFSDYNFEASGLSFILDILAYNAQMNAMTVHLGLNESFLQSAQSRSNVVASANLLGYLPQSNSGATAVVDIKVQSRSLNNPAFLEIPAGFTFYGGGYDWYSTKSITTTNENGEYFFNNVNLRQGKNKLVKYFYDGDIDYQKFEIPDGDVDLSTLIVNVKDSESSSFIQPYFKFSYFNEIRDTTPIYFIQENSNGRYEIYFLNKGIGIHPKNGSIVELSYSYTAGEKANGTSIFTSQQQIIRSGESKNVTTISRASGGADREQMDSIRHNAPYYFQSQNRCVTARDYTSVITEHLPGIVESITTWGGEYNTPPEFGRIFIAIKPVGGEKLSDEQKQFIVRNVVKPKNVATISPIIQDPEFVWIGLDVVVKYNASETTNSNAKIEELVHNTILKFDEKNLQRFEGVFKHSRLLAAIDNTELSIQNSTARVYLIKKLTPNPAVLNQFLIKIPSDLYQMEKETSLISTSPIMISGKRYVLEDSPISGDIFRRRIDLIHYDINGNRLVAYNNIGTMNLQEKTIYLFNLKPDTATDIKLYFEPDSYDIAPFQNQFLRIDPNEVKVIAENDPFSSIGIGNPETYRPTSRSR
jgi:hypothetical protein